MPRPMRYFQAGSPSFTGAEFTNTDRKFSGDAFAWTEAVRISHLFMIFRTSYAASGKVKLKNFISRDHPSPAPQFEHIQDPVPS